jgi:hypothetical protein
MTIEPTSVMRSAPGRFAADLTTLNPRQEIARGWPYSREREESRLLMRHKSFDRLAARLKEPDDVVRRAITRPNPDDLRWWPVQDTQPVKVLVPGHEDQSMIASMGPDRTVRGGGQADLTDMDGTREQVSERPNKTGRQILVDKQPGWLLRQPDYS